MKLYQKSRFFVSILVLTALLFSPLLHIQPIALAASPDIVISQVYGGGGNTGATYTNDFIELFNRGTTSVSLGGWSVQYTSASGTGLFGANSSLITELPSVSLAPGQYYLIQEAQGAGGTTGLPSPDQTDANPINLSGSGGKVALATTTVSLGCNGGSTPCSAAQLALIKDLVGWDGANFYEGSGPAPATTNPTSVQRLSNGCTDTDNNSVDFSVGTAIPRNTASPLNVCPTSTNPSGIGAANPSGILPGGSSVLTVVVTPGANPTSTGITVTGDLSSIGGSAAQTFYDDGTNGDVTAGDNLFSFLTTVPLLTIPGLKTIPTIITDTQLRSSTTNIILGVHSSLNIPIHDIQGASHTSPYLGYWVSTQGIVTAKTGNGFFMQDPNPDSDDATSEAIFFFNSSAPPVNVGDSVIVSGTVAEFRPGGSSTFNLTTTELSTPNRIITVVSSGNPLPAATVVGSGGRTPPTQVIEDDSTSGNVETDNIFDPSTDGIDFYESLEAMLLQVNNAVAVAPTNSFGEIPVLADNGANASVRTSRGGVVIQAGDFNPERIILDDVLTATPIMDTSDTFTGPVIGVLDYNFGNFKLLVKSPLPAILSNGLIKEVTSGPTAYQLSVASFNVENLDPTDPQSKFDTLAGEIVNNLKSPDLIGLQEIQDNNGATNNGVVAPDQTFAKLIAAIQAAGGPTYDYRQINPVDLADGGEPGGNIRVGFLFRTDRGLAFVDRAGGTSTNATTAVSGTSGPELTFSPGRVDPTNAAFTDSRKPLAAEFSFKGDKVFVVVNHLNSKGGDTPLFGFLQPPDLVSEVQRLQQAQVVNDFVDSILAIDAGANVIVLGDLNDFQFSAPLATLKGSVLNDLVNTLPVAEQYTYLFDGNSQVLDHILIGNATFSRPFTYDIVHMNAEFYSRPTDHDPQVANLCVDATPPTISGTLSPGVLWPANHKYVTVNATVQYGDNADPSSVIQLVSVTSNEPDNGLGDGDTPNDIVIVDDFTFKLRAERSGTGQGRVYTVTYQVTDACGNSTLASGNVYVPHDKKDRQAGDSPINVVNQTVAGVAPASSNPLANNRVFLPLIKR